VNQFLNQNGFAHARAAKQANLSALQVRLGKVNDFNAGLKHFERGRLIFKRRGWAMNRIALVGLDWAELVDRFTENVQHAAKNGAANGDGDRFAKVDRLHAADQTFVGLHRDGADAAFTEVLLDFGDDI
jgi:peptide chain release factor 1